MPIVQISKMQHRSGAKDDLPQLDVGELGFATDSRQLFIGNDPKLHDVPSGSNVTLTEVLTAYSNINLSTNTLVGTLTLPTGNLKIANGAAGQVLTSYGANGGVYWSYQTGGSGGTIIAGADSEIQFNTAGGFDASSNLTFNTSTKTLSVDNILAVGNIGATGNISANNVSGNGKGLSSLTGANVTGFVPNANVANTAYRVSGANVVGAVALAALANAVAGANVTGVVANSVLAGTVITGAQPNITSTGTLVSLTVSGTITTSGATGNFSGNFNGNGSQLTSINGANVTGFVGNATFATSSTTASSANSVSGANVVGQVSNAAIAGTVFGNAQPNITAVGRLSTLTVASNITSPGATFTGPVSATYYSGNGSQLTGIFGPYFIATQSVYQNLPTSPNAVRTLDLVYNYPVSNSGTGYNYNTGVFTAQTSGLYDVHASIGVNPMANMKAVGSGTIILYKNGAPIASGNYTGVTLLPLGDYGIPIADKSVATALVNLGVGDTLSCKISYAHNAIDDAWTTQSTVSPCMFQAAWLRP